ncbi:4-alpha-glucanotransferase [Streptomyces iconiensis]|uniref:4-alpha-glucanotransferase n=1 Tax=Streptomyces iconiensis TaxID=1384038 RepID=A0ABT7A5L6_9ACTN|nr:4-alpha-glucanotransferase [Streptomyces iconiensis]MDJ1136596.1 4-alpha-glucanotransferase [Streptomyces iconiensis]
MAPQGPSRATPAQAPSGGTPLARLAAAHGVSLSYEPAPGREVQVPRETVVDVLAALGTDASTPHAVREALERHEWDGLRLLPPTVVLRSGAAGAPTTPPPAPLRPTGARPGSPSQPGSPPRPPQSGSPSRPQSSGSPSRPGHPSRSLPRATLPAGPLAGLPEGTVLRVVTDGGETLDWGPGTALPLGVHTLFVHAPDDRAAHSTLIVAPELFPAPRLRAEAGRAHGLLVQLYSLLSARSWGMGDLGDLSELAAWAGRSLGADFVQLNPLHSAVPSASGERTDPSPYRPSSRRFPDPVHLRIEEIPEYAYLGEQDRTRVSALVSRAASLREAVLRKDAYIERDAVWDLKREALELLRAVPLSPGRRAAFCDFLAERGQALEDHATWCAFAELHGPDWRSWPTGLDDPRSDRTARTRDAHMERVDFHCWAAWLVDSQLAAAQRTARDAGMSVGLVHDLAVGVHPSGADAWAQQDILAKGITVGAPPDAFNARGQDWGLPPWRPDALAEAGYEPYREVLTGLFRHAGALRVDHVMGHSRLWWVPEGRPPTEGTYVRYDTEAMHGVLALEAHRARAAVIGEDLGTVEPGIREGLAARRVLGTSVLWFEKSYGEQAAHPADETAHPAGEAVPLRPEQWRADCLATATTHDLPSTAARLTGEHIALRDRLGLLNAPAVQERAADNAELEEWLGLFECLGLLPEGRGDEEGEIRAVYRFLARTPARLVGVWLPDAVGDRRAQNVPGTSEEYPNWRLPLADAEGRPLPLEDLAASPRVHDLFTALRHALR